MSLVRKISWKSAWLMVVFSLTLVPTYRSNAATSRVVEMIHGWWNEPVNLNPIIASEGFAYTFNILIFDGLVELDDDGVPQPALAERWNISPDGLRYTFFLRKNVTWQDGRPFTADDVLFTVYSHLNPKNISVYRRSFEPLVGYEELTNANNPVPPDALPVKPVVALDKHTVVFRLRHPSASFLSILQTYRGAIAPKHLLEGRNLGEAEFNKRPVGTGRFRLVEWRPGQHMVFEANDKYYRGRPRIDRLIVRIIPDRNVIVEELKKGNVHFVYLPPTERIAELERHPGVKNITKQATNWVGIQLNFRNDLFQDRRVRQAMMHAIDRNAFVKAVYTGYATVATGPITPAHGSWAFNDAIKPYEYNPDRAKRMLAEAGWVPGPDGVLQKGGKRFSFRLVAEKRQQIEDVVVFVQESLRRVGIEVRLEISERAANELKVGRSDYDAAYGHPSGWPDPDPETTNWFHSKGPTNTQAYNNPKVDELLDKGRRSTTIKDRGPVYKELQQILHEDVPWLWLVWIPWVHSWSTKFTGFTGGPAFPVGNYYTMHLVRPTR
jgi:peptide/nickel transport system substrate-binding protein